MDEWTKEDEDREEVERAEADERRARFEPHTPGDLTYEELEASLVEVERLHAGLKRGADWIKANRPDTENGAFIVDVLLAEVERLRAESKTEQEFTNKYIKRLHTAEAEIKRLRADLAAEVADNVSLREKHVTQFTADHVRTLEERLRTVEAERDDLFKHPRLDDERVRTLEKALRAKCDEYKMHDPGFCNSGACDLARAVLREEGK